MTERSPALSIEANDFLRSRIRPAADWTGPCHWYAVFLMPSPGAQGRARAFLERHGFESYCPVSTRLQKRPDRRPGIVKTARGRVYKTEVVKAPLWPRYKFVLLPAIDTPFGLLSGREAEASDVRGLICFGGAPLVIPAAEIEKLKAREAAGEFDQTVRRGRKRFSKIPDGLEIGRTVSVTAGPFAAFLATITDHRGEGIVEVEVKIFGRSTPVEISVDQIG